MKHNCACLWWATAAECLATRLSKGYDPDDVDTLSGEECECRCHVIEAAMWKYAGDDADD